MTEPGGADPRSTGWSSLPPWLTRGLALLVGIGLVGGFVRSEWEQIRKDPGNYVWGVYAILAIAVLYGAWLFLRRRFGPASSFKNPAGLRIGRKYLYGREEETEILAGRLEDNALVFLIGESGAGKSSLLERGLVPALREGGRGFPLYLKHWGSDWIEGPRRALADAVTEALQEAHREKLKLNGAVRPDLVFRVIARLHDELGLRPVLLLDQLDDYQARHRERFLFGPDRQVLRAPELVARNPFWQGVKGLLEAEQARCVVATRDDAQWGLESVRFQEPGIYLLPLLEREHAAALLDKVAADAEVLRPERGWIQLRDRLLRDLAPEGFLLPIQMKVALQGLAELQPVSLPGYVREGGLPGLEALHIARSIAQAARHVRWEPEDVRRLLLAMVDPVTQRKTVPQTIEQIFQTLPQEKRDQEKLSVVLAALRDKDEDVVRDRVDRDLGATVWLLDHDYLCRGVLELDRRARRWQILLEESARSFGEARSPGARWRALLSPGIQLRLLWERLWRRLVYGRARGFAAFSTLRLVGNVWVLAAALGLFFWSLQSERRAQEILNTFSSKTYAELDEHEVRMLWQLTDERESLRKAVLDKAFEGKNGEVFLNRSENLLAASIGLREEAAQGFLREVFREKCEAGAFAQELNAKICESLLATLPADDQTARDFVVLVAKSPDRLLLLNNLPLLRDVLAQSTADEMARQTIEKMELEASPENFMKGMKLLAALGNRLSAANADRAARNALTRSVDPGYPLSNCAGIAPRVSRSVAEELARRAFDFSEAYFNNNRRALLFPLSDRLSPSLVNRVAREISTEDFQRVDARSFTFSNFHSRAEMKLARFPLASVSEPVAREVITRWATGYPFVLWKTYFGEDTPPGMDQYAALVLLASIETESNYLLRLYFLKRFLGLAGRLPPPLAEDVARRCLDGLWASPDFSHIIEEVVGKVPEDLVSAAIASTISEIKNLPAPDNNVLGLARRLAALDNSLAESTAREAVALLIPHLEKATPEKLPYAVTALGELGNRLPPEAADKAAARILERLGAADLKAEEIEPLSAALNTVGGRLRLEAAQTKLHNLVEISRPLSFPPCGAAAGLVRDSDESLRITMDIVKWPTCSAGDRLAVIKQIGVVTGQSFEKHGAVDVWSFVRWARERGFHPELPPQPPERIRVVHSGDPV